MSTGFLCTCKRPGHAPRPGGKPGCGQYSVDQERGGFCAFCLDADKLAHAWAERQVAAQEPAMSAQP